MDTPGLRNSTRSRVLASSVHQLRHDAERVGSGAAVHQLRNVVMTAQGALGLVETHLSQGRSSDVDALLELAETRLREGRRILTQTRLAHYGRRRPGAASRI